jgi:hypothetical protein
MYLQFGGANVNRSARYIESDYTILCGRVANGTGVLVCDVNPDC